jgi:hypothetical protein
MVNRVASCGHQDFSFAHYRTVLHGQKLDTNWTPAREAAIPALQRISMGEKSEMTTEEMFRWQCRHNNLSARR